MHFGQNRGRVDFPGTCDAKPVVLERFTFVLKNEVQRVFRLESKADYLAKEAVQLTSGRNYSPEPGSCA